MNTNENASTGTQEAEIGGPVLHIRQIGAWRHNLCSVVGGEAADAHAATCGHCIRVLVEAEPKFAHMKESV